MFRYCDKMLYTLILCVVFFTAVNADVGDPCNATVPCAGDNNYCDDNQCRCTNANYPYYNPDSGTCQNNCTNYGDSYTILERKYPSGITSLLSYFYVHDICECAQRCTNTSECTAADFDTDDYPHPEGACYLYRSFTTFDDFNDSRALIRHCGENQQGQNLTGNCTYDHARLFPELTSQSPSCTAGTESNSNGTGCDMCEGNTYSTEGGDCTPCDGGYSANSNHTACIQTQNLNFTNVEQRSLLKGKEKFAAEQAIDGDDDTCAKTKEHHYPWWRGELSAEAFVTQVTITNVGPAGTGNITLEVFIGTNANYQSQSCGIYNGPKGEDPTFYCPFGTYGDFVTIVRQTNPGQKRRLRNCETRVVGYYV